MVKKSKKSKKETALEVLNNPVDYLIMDLFKHDNRSRQMVELREKIESGENNFFPVFSPLGLNELMKWNAEVTFKQVSSEAIGTKNIQRISEKEIGDKLKTLLKSWNELSYEEKTKQSTNYKKEGLRRLFPDFFLNISFLYSHGLRGLTEVDIIKFDYSTSDFWKKTSDYSYLQIGATDIMHILFAKHLGCEYIASKDSDFKRASEFIKEDTGIEVLYGYDQILKKI